MKKLAKILATSVGAGFLAGAGFRLGESLAAERAPSKPEPARPAEEAQAAIVHRISLLEKEVAGHSAGLSELRECSLRTERSLQKLLLSIDRLIVPLSPTGTEPAADDALFIKLEI